MASSSESDNSVAPLDLHRSDEGWISNDVAGLLGVEPDLPPLGKPVTTFHHLVPQNINQPHPLSISMDESDEPPIYKPPQPAQPPQPTQPPQPRRSVRLAKKQKIDNASQ